MIRKLLLSLALIGTAASAAPAAPPPAPVEPVTDDYYGTKVTDPYRWMESGKDPRWLPWLHAQADATHATFATIPARAKFLADAQALSGDVTTVQRVASVGNTRFVQRRDAGAEDSRLYIRTDHAAERLLIDPVKLVGPDQVLDWWEISPGGRYVAAGISRRGSEASVVHVVETATGRLLPDRIPKADFGIGGWLPDNSGFTYITFIGEKGTPNYLLNSSPRLHLLGQPVARDRVLVDRDHPPVPLVSNQFAMVAVQDDSTTALLNVFDGRQEQAFYRTDLTLLRAGRPVWQRVHDFDDLIEGDSLSGDRLWLLSRKDAGNGRVLLTSAARPDLAHARTIAIPGNPVIERIMATRSGALVQTIEGGQSGLWRVTPTGGARRVALPVAGTIGWLQADSQSDAAYVGLAGWFSPSRAFALSAGNHLTDLGLVTAQAALDPSRYEARSFTARARDGVAVPYTVIARKGLASDGRNPLLLEAYGSYGIAVTPRYRSPLIPFLDRGGIYVIANVRGGGEFGRAWHYAGKAETKANTWRDAIDVAETLVKSGWTTPARMTLLGTSAGGIMVGQAVNERPDLFNGAIANVGFMNPIRYVAEENVTDIQEWGGPIADAKSFKTMFDMDPYQHIRSGTRYPATLVVSGLNDPRAATFHGAKYAARLAAATTSGEPVLLRIDFGAGHGIDSSRTQSDELWTDIYSFALWRGGVADFKPR